MSEPLEDRQAIEIAAAWAEEARSGLTARRTAALDEWLEQSEGHRRAFDQVQAADDALVRHSAGPELMALRVAALKARPERSGMRLDKVAAALAALAVMVAGAWWGAAQWPRADGALASAVYRTEPGERSTVTLPDGSVVTLNTATVLEVEYSRGERLVRLRNGQAIFTVAHEQATPFRVVAGNRIVTATGTLFEVRLDQGETRVALLEGGVRVVPLEGAPDGAAISLAPGEVLIAPHEGPSRVRRADVVRLAEWRSGLVSFDETPLGEAVKEMNRYGGPRIVINEPSVSSLRLSGVFRTGESERFARTAAEALSIETSSEDGTIILSSGVP